MALVSGQNGTFRRTEKWSLVLPEAKESCRGQCPCPSKHRASGGGGPLGWQERGFAGGAIPTVTTAPEASGLPGSPAGPSALQRTVHWADPTCSHDSPEASEQPRGICFPKRRQLVSWRQDCGPRLSFSWWCAGPACTCSRELIIYICPQLLHVQDVTLIV